MGVMKMELVVILIACCFSCKKDNNQNTPPPPEVFQLTSLTVNGNSGSAATYFNYTTNQVIKISFSSAIDTTTTANSVSIVNDNNGNVIQSHFLYQNNDSSMIVQPISLMDPITPYQLKIFTSLKSIHSTALNNTVKVTLITAIDSTDKFPQISDSALLDLVEQQTFNYFWTFGHPVSGMARERNSDLQTVTTGGSGFGVMALLVGIQRNFISRAQGLTRIDTIVNFLTNKAHRYHGAFPHWMDGTTGATIPFSTQDDGADLVETSYMMQGLLTARQFFNTNDPTEVTLRNNINNLWNAVEWNWFRQNGQNVLYWHWSPDYFFAINQQISGWDEAMIVYAFAASSTLIPTEFLKLFMIMAGQLMEI